MENKKIKIGVIGCGSIFKAAHIFAYSGDEKIENVEVVALCDIIIERAQEGADKLRIGYEHCYKDFN